MKNVFFVIMLGVALTLGLVVAGCKNGCSGDGACYFGTAKDDTFKWCGEQSCAVYKNDNSKCDC
jgi:hypothetical protein